jgi:hypothetical protein
MLVIDLMVEAVCTSEMWAYVYETTSHVSQKTIIFKVRQQTARVK